MPEPGQVLVLALLVGTPVLLFLALRTIPGLDLLFQSLLFHLIVVSAIASCALLVAVLAATAAARARQFSLVMLSLGCLFVGFFMLVHGLTTPVIFGRPMNLWVARAPSMALAAFAACLGVALIPPDRRFARFIQRHARAAILVPAALAALACGAAIAWPAAWIGGHAFRGEDVVLKVVAAVTALALFVTGAVHRWRWQLSRDRLELALLLACWLSAESVVSLQLGRFWHLSWWDYHALLLVGFGSAVAAVLSGYHRSRTLQGALTGVVLKDTVEQLAHGYPEAVRSLVTAVEARDSYTKGHSTRVADLSVRIGERMGLRPDALRSLARGGMLHDIGKIGVPDQILNKPGILTPTSGQRSRSTPTWGGRSSASLRRCRAPSRWSGTTMNGSTAPAIRPIWPATTSRWKLGSPPWPTCGMPSRLTAPIDPPSRWTGRSI
jgi:hypothetical protein